MAYDYDLFVIGGGSGGVRAARVAAGECGKRVGLAEESRMGGTCVIRGCVPKKLMVFASGHGAEFADAARYGWDVRVGGFDWAGFRAHLHAELDRLEGVYRANLDRAGVVVHDTHAEIADPHTVRLATGETVTAEHILVATGGWPHVPDMPGAGHVLTSNEMFHLDALPERLLIVGGGYIACEFACIMNGLGVEVTQYVRGAQILRGFDEEARGHIAGLMEGRGIHLRCGTSVMDMAEAEGGMWVKSTEGRETVFGKVMFATGRRPNTAGLGLEEAGVELTRWGAVKVDAYSRSAVPSIHAIGDVTDRLALTPVAIREGAAFVETVFKDNPTSPDHEAVPTAIFTQPEYGGVGMTEEAARDAEPIEVYATAFRPMHEAFIGGEERVLMKLIVSRATRRVLGCHIVAPHAGELIQLAGVAVKMGATKEDFDRTVAVHPTMTEEIVTMRAPVRGA